MTEENKIILSIAFSFDKNSLIMSVKVHKFMISCSKLLAFIAEVDQRQHVKLVSEYLVSETWNEERDFFGPEIGCSGTNGC